MSRTFEPAHVTDRKVGVLVWRFESGSDAPGHILDPSGDSSSARSATVKAALDS